MTEQRCRCVSETYGPCPAPAGPDGYCDWCRPGPGAACPVSKEAAS